MKVIVEAAIIDEKEGEIGRQDLELEQLGSEGWVRMTIGSQVWDIDYRDFWNAARAVGVEAPPL